MESGKFSFKIIVVLCFLFVVCFLLLYIFSTPRHQDTKFAVTNLAPKCNLQKFNKKSVFLLQHYLTAFGSTLSVPLVLQSAMCIGDDRVGLSEIISTIFFVSGLSTLLQTTFGVRHVKNILTFLNYLLK